VTTLVDIDTKGDAAKDDDSGGSESRRQRRHERQPPKVISPSDPQSAWTAKANKRLQFGYGLNYLIDVEATPAPTYDEVAIFLSICAMMGIFTLSP